MKILAVDTALGACSVAILDGDNMLAHELALMDRGQAEALAPMVENAMNIAKLSFAALDRLAVTTGPGTFTGQRVGLAFMRGLRVALGKPLSGVTTLAAMARAAMAETGLDAAAALHDARRGEVYLGIAGANAIAPAILPFEEAVETISRHPGAIALAGTAAPAASVRLANSTLSAVRQPDALWVARLARHMLDTGTPPKPLYLRAPDAKLPIRKMSPSLFPSGDDPEPLAAIHAACFADGWNGRAIAELLATPGAFAFAVESGFVLLRAGGGEAEILTLAVVPGSRRLGVARALVTAAASHAHLLGAETLFLEVAVGNEAARALYRRLGFAEAGRRKAYYATAGADPEDALLLRSKLPLSPLGESSSSG